MDKFIVVILQSYTFRCHAFVPACPVLLLPNELRGRICVWDCQYCTEFLRWAGSTFQMNISTTFATSHSHKLSFCLWSRNIYPKAWAYFWHRCLYVRFRLINLYLLSAKDSARDFVSDMRNLSTGMHSMTYFLLPPCTTENKNRESQPFEHFNC